MTQFLRRSPAVRLLDRILVDSDVSPSVLARSLGIPIATLDAYRDGRERMPVAVRLRLAEFVLLRVPQHARPARQLRATVEAELAFAKTTTVVHKTAPPSRFGS
jgi:hypothetical protein